MSSESPDSASPSSDTSEAGSQFPPKPQPPRIKIGSQRPGAPPVKARPQAGLPGQHASETSHPVPTDQPIHMDHTSSQAPRKGPDVSEVPASEIDAALASASIDTAALDTGSQNSAAASDTAGTPPQSAASPASVPAGNSGQPGGGRNKPGKFNKDNNRQKQRPVEETPMRMANVPVPNIRQEFDAELQAELYEALGDVALDEILDEGTTAATPPPVLLPETRHQARVVKIHRDNVFLEIGRGNQGVIPLKTFLEEIPEVGAVLEVTVQKFDADEGLYHLSTQGGAVDIADWSELREGIIVDARITGHNKGGLECEVSKIRGFIPAGQVSPYRVEDLSQFVGEKLTCLVTEANPHKRNLVLSRRSVIEREKAEAKEKMLADLAVGQVYDGVVRSLQEYGAFVDIGGVDGLLHISQLSWQRIKHPSEVLEVGQSIKVSIRKIDLETGKISFAFRDLLENPWDSVAEKYPITSVVTGTVSKIMQFGAFVQLEPGVEGMVHISELAHSRVFRVSDVVKEGQEVECKILGVDVENQRISLSIKATMQRPESGKKPTAEPEEDLTPLPPLPVSKVPLKGGREKASGGEKFGLNW